MRRGGVAAIAVLSLLLVPLGAGLGTGDPSPAPLSGTDQQLVQVDSKQQAPVQAAHTSLEAVAAAEGEGSATASMANLAQAALGFTQAPGVGEGDPLAVLEALGPLLQARGDATAHLVPGRQTDHQPPITAMGGLPGLGGPTDPGERDTERTGRFQNVDRGALAALDLSGALWDRPLDGAIISEDARARLLATTTTGRQLLEDAQTYEALVDDPGASVRQKVQAALQLHPIPAPEQALPAAQTYTTLPAALHGLVAWYGYTPTAEEREQIRHAGDLPTPTEEALTRVIEAHLLQAQATKLAVPALGSEDANTQDELTSGTDVDLPLLAAARAAVAAELLESLPGLVAVPTGGMVDLGPVVSIDLQGADNHYEDDRALQIDLGGDDTYENNAGGGVLGAGMVVDVAGDDTYDAGPEILGATGSGGPFLWRAESRARTGGGLLGSGFLLDADGDDRYAVELIGIKAPPPSPPPNIVTAANGGGNHGTGALIDLGGKDRYVARATSARGQVLAGFNGGTGLIPGCGESCDSFLSGSGFLYDERGSDTYEAAILGDRRNNMGGVNGGGYAGSALLVDQGGDDTYQGAVSDAGGVNGGTFGGFAGLLDHRGNDTYRGQLFADPESSTYTALPGYVNSTLALSEGGGINGGAVAGLGILRDGGGDDRYLATSGGETGANGGGVGGTGLLLDAAGSDVYRASIGADGAVNGAGNLGTGVLADGEGSDVYIGFANGTFGAVNGASASGVGVLYDAGGSDDYRAHMAENGGANGGTDLGIGVLVDAGGSDTYHALLRGYGGANGGAFLGLGLLVDPAGDNRFEGEGLNGSGISGSTGGLPVVDLDGPPLYTGGILETGSLGGIGILIGSAGNDTYRSAGTTQGAATGYGLGLLVDPGGNNTYTAGPTNGTGLAQGAGQHGGLGILIDHGNSTFTLSNQTTGQGTGQQGVGLLLHANASATARFETAPDALAGLLDGAGIGLRIALGNATVVGPQPTFTCETSPKLLSASATLDSTLLPIPIHTAEAHVCAPDETTRRPILNPLTGEPFQPQPKPGVDCTELPPVAGNDCSNISPDLAAFLADDEVTMTTSGGTLVQLLAKAAGSQAEVGLQADYELSMKHTVETFDRMCRHSCVELAQLDDPNP